MNAAGAFQAPVRGAEVWPLSVEAYHALGEARLIPERTELLYGFVYHKWCECWLVLGQENLIEVHRQPAEGKFAERVLHGPGGELASAAIPGFMVDLDKLFGAA